MDDLRETRFEAGWSAGMKKVPSNVNWSYDTLAGYNAATAAGPNADNATRDNLRDQHIRRTAPLAPRRTELDENGFIITWRR